MAADEPGTAAYDGLRGTELADRLAVPRVATFETVGSTLDIAHRLAEAGAPAGTLVIADAQTSGRGRPGRVWRSEAGAGIWLTLIERPSDPSVLDVLSLRVGLALAPVLDPFATSAVQLKWPNDLYVDDRKLGGVLVEARWREGIPEWVAIGVGVNVRAPIEEPRATGLREHIARLTVLDVMVPALRGAAALQGLLGDAELRAFASRDMAVGRRCIEPVAGTVRGIDPTGALCVVRASTDDVVTVRAGSLVLAEEL